MKVAVVGATGLVGRVILKVLEERDFPVEELIPVASSKSFGKIVKFKNSEYKVISLDDALNKHPDIALFSAGGRLSKEWAPKFAEKACTVIDNSSAWRMENGIPLIIPELNPESLSPDDRIIANPNCSTIQMLMALAPLHKNYGIKRIVVSTYQSVTGSGAESVKQLEEENKGISGYKVYPYSIFNNCLPHCADFEENDYTSEEMKLVNETRKIFGDPSIMVSATAVRIPVTGGHSESINVEFHKEFILDDIRNLIENFPGVVLQDDPSRNLYPMPLSANNRDEVFVGRLRRDISQERSLNMWVVSDNLRKGAATNAVQIAELLIS